MREKMGHRAVQKTANQFRITLPRKAVTAMGLKDKTELAVYYDKFEQEIVLKRRESVVWDESDVFTL